MLLNVSGIKQKQKSMNKLFLGIFLLASICLTSCLDLAPNLFNPTQIDEYLYDEYADSEDQLPAEYDLLAGELTEFTVESELDGITNTIYGAYLGDINTISEDTVILYCHGNSGTMDWYFQRTKLLYNTKAKSHYGVLLFDYQGYGRSEGNPSEAALVADAHAMVNWLANQGLTGDRLYVYGFSLGSIPAVELNANPKHLTPARLLLEAPIGSIDAMAEDGSGLSIPASFFADLGTNNIELIKSVEQPLYWIHGIADDFLAMNTHGQPIFDNHSGVFKFSEKVPNGNHGDTPFILGLEPYLESLETFLLRKI